jgi:hypothetical protein
MQKDLFLLPDKTPSWLPHCCGTRQRDVSSLKGFTQTDGWDKLCSKEANDSFK